MIIVDAQISPIVAAWITEIHKISAVSVRSLGFIQATDYEIFMEAKKQNAIVLTKDEDFVQLLYRLKSPPKIIWLKSGNTSNKQMKKILLNDFSHALAYLERNDLVELRA
jgi:predicted nuclease of predicted toxin-antitoxin system